MHSPNPPRPPYPPRPGARPAESDRNLLAQVGEARESPRAVALLLARHWRPVHAYAVICLASSGDSASMAAAAAFRRELARPGGGALRPRLLAAVRDTVGEWACDEEISGILPELRKTVGARGLRAARSATPERRRLAERAFRALPAASQCLLWHTEVEAEPLCAPAVLLGVDPGTAKAALQQAREQFRTGCVRAHRELAPTPECRYYNRLLDVPMRRGGALLPDVQRHLMACRYCRHAAEQLSHFEGGLEDLLVETVLGWGARRYLESRPGRAPEHNGPPAGGRHRLRPRVPQTPGRSTPPRRHPKALAAAVGVTALVLLATLLATRGWTEEGGAADPRATWGVAGGHLSGPEAAGTSPGAPDPAGPDARGSSPVGSPSAASAGHVAEVARGRLRNQDEELCLDVRDGRIRTGARIVLTACSAGSPQWSYQDDGLLRSATDPTLCLRSDTGTGAVALAGCLVPAGVVRYDLTVRGELLPRGGTGRAVAPGKGRDVIVTGRDGSRVQRWTLERAATPGPPADRRAGDAPAQSPRRQERHPYDSTGPGRRSEPARPGAPETPQEPGERYETRVAQVDCCAQAEPGTPVGEAAPPPGTDVLAPVTATVADAVTSLESAVLP